MADPMESKPSAESARWQAAAEAAGYRLSAERVAAIAPVLEGLEKASRRALDRDLMFVEPAFRFRPVRSEAE